MSYAIIDFKTLKFNLYDVLGISQDASDTKIRKAFKNLILNFHPDKNNNTEEEIYYHIIYANQILTNSENRKKYNDYLNKLQNTYCDLKESFINNHPTEGEQPLTKEKACIDFAVKSKKINEKHFNNFNENDTTMNAYTKLLNERKSQIEIPEEHIQTPEDFNKIFESRSLKNNYSNTQIIPVPESINQNYVSLDVAFNNLYIENDGLNSESFSNLNAAFQIQPINMQNFKEVDIKKAFELYKNQTNILYSIHNT